MSGWQPCPSGRCRWSRRGLSSGSVAITAWFLAACSSGDSSVAVTRTDSAGVEIVVSHGRDRVLDRTFTPTVRIGGADTGAASFYDISAGMVAADTAGRIFVLDRQAFRISAFDVEGNTLWSSGREGGAPGEFKFLFGVQVRGDTVEVLDGGGPELERFEAGDGTHLHSERLGRFVSRAVPTPVGLLVDIFERTGDGGGDAVALVNGMDTTRLASIAHGGMSELVFEDCPVRLMVRVGAVLAPGLSWQFGAGRLFVNTGAEYRIDVFEDTTRVASFRRDLTPIPATAELAAAEYPDGFQISLASRGVTCRMSGEEAVSKLGFAPVVPFVRGLAVAPDGTLWVRRNPTRAQLGTFDLFAADGAYTGTLRDVPVPAAFLPGNRIVGIEKDEMDIERVVVYEVDASP